jgi:hypothetical protein
MSKHAKKSTKASFLIAIVAAGAVSFAGITASANTVDVSNQRLDFNSGAAPGNAAVDQNDGEDSGDGKDIGENLAVDDVIHYYDLVTIGATTIDARITMLAEQGIESSGGTDGLLDKLDDATGSAGGNVYLNTELDMNETTGESFVEFRVEFLTDLTTTANSGVPVTLSNVELTVMDVDSYQYVQLSGAESYTVSENTILSAQPISEGVTRYVETEGIGTSSGDADYEKSRISLKLGNVSQIDIRLGQDVLSGTESSAHFDLDFSSGGVWSIPETQVEAPQLEPTPYVGVVPAQIDSCIPTTGGQATLTGTRLSGITSVVVDGQAATVISADESSAVIDFPALTAGTYDVDYFSASKKHTHLNGLRVCNVEPAAAAAASGDFYVFKRFSGYQGDVGLVVESDRSAITAFIEANPGIERVTCLGSTSGVPAIETDEALAQARATNACSVVNDFLPGVSTKTATITGRGVGQFHRAVILYAVGSK